LFNPTKSHISNIDNQSNQYKLRIGSRVPEDAANLAYSFCNPLNSLECVRIADTSSLIPENIISDSLHNIELWPDNTHMLNDLNGLPDINSQTFLITDVFQDGNPLYYGHILKYPIVDKVGPDTYGFYLGKGITIIDKNNQRPNAKYKIALIKFKSDIDNIYKVMIYTDFQTDASDNIKVIYNGVTVDSNNFIIPYAGYVENLNPQPAFECVSDIDQLTDPENTNAPIYVKTNSKQAGSTRAYVTKTAVSDTRNPVYFKYRVFVKVTSAGLDYYFSTPWSSDSVLNEASLIEEDYASYHDGRKFLSNKTAFDLVNPYITIPANQITSRIYSVEYVKTDDRDIELTISADGNNPVLAKTDSDTGILNLPADFITKTLNIDQPVDIQIVAVKDATQIVVQTITSYVNNSEGSKVVTTLSVSNFTQSVDSSYELRVVSLNNLVDVRLVKNINIVNGNGENQTSYNNILIGGYKVVILTNYVEHVFLPTYSLSLNDKRQIKVLNSVENSSIESWYPRIRSGRFERTVIENGIYTIYMYSIPEYFRQSFSETYGMPYREVVSEVPVITGDRTIKLRYAPLYVKVDENHIPINLEVKVNSALMPISNWNLANGSIELMASVRSSDRITVNYVYEENNYTYRGFWDEINQHFWSLDLNPGHGHYITTYDSETREFRTQSSFLLINQIIYIYLRPSARLLENTTKGLDIIYGSFNKNPLFHSFVELDEPNLLLIGKIHVRPNSIYDSIKVTDTRSRGGGLKEEIGDVLIKKFNVQANFYWDISFWDGEPYPENAVLIIKLPRSILIDFGGRFAKQEIEAAVEKYIAYGTFYIIEYLNEPDELIGIPKNLYATAVEVDEIINKDVPIPDFKLEVEVI